MDENLLEYFDSGAFSDGERSFDLNSTFKNRDSVESQARAA